MAQYSNSYQDELGVAWYAIDPNLSIIASRLKTLLRRQSRWITAGLAIGLPLCAAGILLGVTSIGVGGISAQWHFVTRGIAWVAMSAILAYALASLVDVRSERTASELSAMLDLAIDRAQKTLSLIAAGFYACVIAAIFGLAGAALRTRIGRPPQLSPIVALAILALIASVLFLYRRQVWVKLGKYRALRQAVSHL
jgi:hypothetical protein